MGERLTSGGRYEIGIRGDARDHITRRWGNERPPGRRSRLAVPNLRRLVVGG
jgi:hypothetical protein